MNKTPLVSVIIPTYNRLHTIGETLKSVKNQTYKNWECIVVDDGSSDLTSKLLQEYAEEDHRFKFYKRPTERIKGAPTCRNIGIEKSKGEYVIFLDSDDFLLNHCLSTRIQYFLSHKDLKFLVFPMAIIRQGIAKKEEIKETDNYLKGFLKYDLPWQTMCPIWETNFIKGLHGYTEGYSRFDDPEFHIRAIIIAKGAFKVFHQEKEDCVYDPNPNTNTKHFALLCYESLHLFITDITLFLNTHKINGHKYMVNYFLISYKTYANFTKYDEFKKLLLLLKKNGVISLRKYALYSVSIFLIKSFDYFAFYIRKKVFGLH